MSAELYFDSTGKVVGYKSTVINRNDSVVSEIIVDVGTVTNDSQPVIPEVVAEQDVIGSTKKELKEVILDEEIQDNVQTV